MSPTDVFDASIEDGVLIIGGVAYEGEMPESIEYTLHGGMRIYFLEHSVDSWAEAVDLGLIASIDGIPHGPEGYRRDCRCLVCVSAGRAGVLRSTLGDMTPDIDDTPKVHDLIESVTDADDAVAELADWLRGQPWSEFATSLVKFYDDRGFLTPKQIAAAVKMRAKTEAKDVARHGSTSGGPTIIEDGMYLTPDGVVYKVQKALHGSGRLYAKRLTIPDDPSMNGKFEMEVGAVYRLTPDMKMSLEMAQGFGALYGLCVCCGAVLTNEESIQRGVGPICATRI